MWELISSLFLLDDDLFKISARKTTALYSFKITQRKFRLALKYKAGAPCTRGSWTSSCPQTPKISANMYLYVYICFFLADNFQEIIRGIYNTPSLPKRLITSALK